MKSSASTKKTIVLLALLLSAMAGISRQKVVAPYYNSLLINNKAFNYADFSIVSRGLLTVIVANPKTAEVEAIPFRAYLRRNGKNLTCGVANATRSLLVVDLASVLATAKLGDDLVIEPTRKCDARAGRSIKLNPYLFNFNLLSFIRGKKGGC